MISLHNKLHPNNSSLNSTKKVNWAQREFRAKVKQQEELTFYSSKNNGRYNNEENAAKQYI